MRPRIVVGDLGVRVDGGDHSFNPFGWRMAGAQHEASACALDLVQRADARQHACGKQRAQPLQQFGLGDAEGRCGFGIRMRDQWQAALQRVDDAAVERVECCDCTGHADTCMA